MKLPLAALAAIVAVPLTGHAAPPPPEALAGTSSSNVQVLNNLPTGVGIGGKFSGGYYYQTTARSVTYGAPDAPSDGGLVVLDVKDPENPVPAGHLPLPIWQNEDVEVSAERKIVLISADRKKSATQVNTSPVIPGSLYVVDIATPQAPRLRSVLAYPATVGTKDDGTPLGGPGHIANCILGCTYVYVTGSRDRSVHVVDLRNLEAPKLVGTVRTPAGNDAKQWDGGAAGVVHDVNVDTFGNVWMTGSGGTAMYAPIKDPLKPVLLAATTKKDNTRTNQLIHHGSMRLDKSTVLVGEESFGGCGGDGDQVGGRLQRWNIDLARKRLVPIAHYSHSAPDVTDCSSHWFDVSPLKVVADAWYGAGVRFFDVSKPGKIRPIGYYRGYHAGAGQAQFVPGRPDLVYVSDYLRGLDVVKIDDAGKGAPTTTEEDGGTPGPAPIWFRPDSDFGMACRVPVLG